jgi:murein DD-endopeptidase MepM/ murein hydrolase activator NlpD
MLRLKISDRISIILILLIFSSFQPQIALAQTPDPDLPVYIIQSGDYLSTIASRFGISVDTLQEVNGITDPNNIAVGNQLKIPGLTGVKGILETRIVPLGDNYNSIIRHYQINQNTFNRINHLTSPQELYAGVNLIIPQNEAAKNLGKRATLQPGQSLLETAVLQDTSPWIITNINNLAGSWDAIPNDVFYLPGESSTDSGIFLPGVAKIMINPLPLKQGDTITIRITTNEPITLSGSLAGNELQFFEEKPNSYVALQGIHAMAEAGIYPFTIRSSLSNGQAFDFEQNIILQSGNFAQDPPFNVADEYVDPNITGPELEQLAGIVKNKSAVKLWNGKFLPTSPNVDCYTSRFGNRRSYNGSEYIYFHSGVDYCGGNGTQIFAPANGVVTFTGNLTVRGNVTIIDHGWGVYTGYFHQSEIKVNVGDKVEPGQEIGLVGDTGRVTGGHLHWELWVGGVSVNPLDWIDNDYPNPQLAEAQNAQQASN